jgi:hypothetical protein
MPKQHKKHAAAKRANHFTGPNINVNRDLMNSTRLTSNMTDSHDMRDLYLEPPARSIDDQVIPRNYISLPFFRKGSYQKTIAYAGGGTEVPVSLLITDFFSGTFVQFFDQYCFSTASVSVSLSDLVYSSSVSADAIKYASAIDFDNAGTGYASAIERFGSYRATAMTPTISQTRVWRPTSKILMSGTGGSRTSGIVREWVDSTYTDISHYGYKGLLYSDPNASANITIIVSVICGFRNVQ